MTVHDRGVKPLLRATSISGESDFEYVKTAEWDGLALTAFPEFSRHSQKHCRPSHYP